MAASPTERAATVVLVLAAGAGSRYTASGHKLLASGVDGRSVLDHSLAAALEAAIGPVVVVTGAIDPVLPDGVERVHNPDWADGQITSLRRGVEAARALGADRVVVGLGDQPYVSADAWRLVAAASAPIAVATYDGRRRNPVKLESSVWDLLPRTGDEGARALMRLRPDLVGEVPCSGSPADIDTVEDVRRWQNN